jgi:hypothetical protein
MKIPPVGMEMLHADGRTGRQTDMSKVKVAFCKFENAPEKVACR